HRGPARHGKRGAAAAPGERHARDPHRHGDAGAGEPLALLRGPAGPRPRGVTLEHQAPFEANALPASADPLAASAAQYATEVAEVLYGLLVDVVKVRHPFLEVALAGGPMDPSWTPEQLEACLRAQGIWFQLLAIAEQNAGMRRRRQTETERGFEQVRGTLPQV